MNLKIKPQIFTPMKSILKIVILSLTVVLFNCKKDGYDLTFKYASNPVPYACENNNNSLYSEALYSFENDILKYYGINKRNKNALPNLNTAYKTFISNIVYNNIPYEKVISAHSIEVFKALKKDGDLWDAQSPNSHLNYSSNIISCIAKNIKNENLKTTFNSLLSVNNLSSKLFGPALRSSKISPLSDKHLASYIALEMYYSKLFDIDLTKIPSKQAEDTKTDADKNEDPHAGHDH